MNFTGVLKDVSRDWMTGKYNITFTCNEESAVDQIASIQDCEKLSIEAKQHRNKRSLTANAYFHVLVGKIADTLGISKTRCKNILIGRYGQQEFLEEGSPVILKTNIGVDKMLEQEFLHCAPCGCKSENGTEVVFYKVFRGSHTYDTKEMSVLIDGTVQEAKDLGIETLPLAELERMVNMWKPQK